MGRTRSYRIRVRKRKNSVYGKAILYSKHDKVQIVYMNQQLKEYYNTTEENNKL